MVGKVIRTEARQPAEGRLGVFRGTRLIGDGKLKSCRMEEGIHLFTKEWSQQVEVPKWYI